MLTGYRVCKNTGREYHWKWDIPGYVYISVLRDNVRMNGIRRAVACELGKAKDIYLGSFLRVLRGLLGLPKRAVTAWAIPRLIRWLAAREALFVPGVGRYRDEVIRNYLRVESDIARILGKKKK